MTTTRLDELSPEAQTEVLVFVDERFPGYELPEADTNIRITGQRVEFRVFGEKQAEVMRTVHMQITDTIASSILDTLTEKTP